MWGSAGFVRIYGHMIHRRPTDTAVAIGCLYRDRREGYRHGGRQAVRKRQQCPPRTVDRAGHPRPRHALPDCPTLFGTLQHRPLRAKYRATQGLAAVGFAGALGLGWDAYQQSRVAWSMFDDPTLKGSILPYMQTGMAFGRMAQATTLGVGSTAQLEILKLSVKRGAGRVAGKAFLPIMLGVEGLRLATAYHEYGLGRISQREFYRRSAGPAIMAVFTGGGATVGGIVGFQAGGVGAIPGAIMGASIGAFASIPVQFAFDYGVDWYYREFDEKQRRVVNAAVETFYGLEPRGQVVQH